MSKVMVIAELGINHNGDIEIAKRLIDLAKDCGCDMIKFQKRTIDKVYTQEFLDSPRKSPWGTTQREQKEGLEFEDKEYEWIESHCCKKDIPWFASAWDIESQRFLNTFETIVNNKIASAMIVCEELLEMVAKEHKHTFISTGMSSTKQIERAVEIFKQNQCAYELMHCVSTYPMEDSDANLKRMVFLNSMFFFGRHSYCYGVGYSGHEAGGSCAISLAAVALGATCIERHITLDRSMYGSDQASSLSPDGLRRLVGGIRKIEKAMGDGKIDMSKKERPVAEKLRAHLKW